MKNIHVLPTDKPSRLFYSGNSSKLTLNKYSVLFRVSPQNIYITSDEEIKQGNWYLTSDNKILKCKKALIGLIYSEGDYGRNPNGCKKIILTTDQDLIKDGVQAINDEFLEWFVKNPNCEWVKVRKNPKVNAIVKGFGVKSFNNGYRIVIPKEEPNIIDQWLEKNGNPEITKQVDEEAKKLQKQHLIDMMKQDEELGLYEQTKCYCGHTITCDCGPEQEIKLEEVFNDDKRENIKKFIDEINNPSQPNQALKDAAERLKGKELFKESNDRARKTLSEIKSLPIQETLEEVAEKYVNSFEFGIAHPRRVCKNAFINGAKWQAEKMYSEEDMAESFMACWKANVPEGFECKLSFKEWFEQFKNK